jgi:hypothetical protein
MQGVRGWGLPVAWQGWLVLAAFLGAVAAGAFLFPPRRMLAVYLVYVFVLCGVLTGVCYLKGERPRWRWGNEEGDR